MWYNHLCKVNNKYLKDKNIERRIVYMKAEVDRGACISCGLCESICPDVFKLDEESISTVIADPVPEQSEECAKEAEEQCPTNAIHVD
jgi:ferredoxin